MADNRRQVIRALARKGWLDTRWRFLQIPVWAGLFLALNYRSRYNPGTGRFVLFLMWLVLISGVMPLAGSGAKSQSSAGFPEGLAESTQFTLALPVSRGLLLAVRTAVGMVEMIAATAILECAAWALFPSVAARAAPADFVQLWVTTVLCLALPYAAAVAFETILPEPLSFLCAGWALTLVLLGLHQGPPALDVTNAFGAASPLTTHRIPWPQLATSLGLTTLLFWAAARIVKRREY